MSKLMLCFQVWVVINAVLEKSPRCILRSMSNTLFIIVVLRQMSEQVYFIATKYSSRFRNVIRAPGCPKLCAIGSFIQQFVQTVWQQRKIITPHYWPFEKGTHWWRMVLLITKSIMNIPIHGKVVFILERDPVSGGLRYRALMWTDTGYGLTLDMFQNHCSQSPLRSCQFGRWNQSWNYQGLFILVSIKTIVVVN